MDSSPALLLLLALGLCEYGHTGGFSPAGCPGIHGWSNEMKIRSHNNIAQLRVGQRLELECQTDKESGAFWIRQDKSGTLHFIVFISSISRTTFSRDHNSPSRFEASKDNKIYRLVVKSLTPQDEGKYFCLMNVNQMLHFSPGLPIFLPVTTTVAPTTSRPTPMWGTDPHTKTPDPERRKQEELNFFCHISIWVPLAGACLLLLIALAVTIPLCRRTRRRRCRCKR
ncbi:CD8A protein, partial [Pardalotus punctatus]|nr:CD8A protein [Pardalotus punctatus]